MIVEQLLEEAFKGRKRESGEDYFNHCLRVAGRMTGRIERIAALAHDFIEDVGSEEDLRALLNSSGELSQLEIDGIVQIVLLLTRKKGQNYFDFITSLAHSRNRAAIKIKLADLYDNMRDAKEGARLDKYRFAKSYLLRLLFFDYLEEEILTTIK